MESVVRSLQSAEELARGDEIFLQMGKLQMQSRIDSLVTVLDGHIRDCRLVLDTPPGGAASKRAIARDLLSRLQIGGAEQRSAAMETLADFMGQDDKNVLLVAEVGVTALVHALDGVTTVAAATALAEVAAVKPAAVVSDGAVAPLVRLLGGGGGASEPAARALQSVTAGGGAAGENARLVAAHGGAASLVALCGGGTPAAQAAAAGVLRNLSTVEEIRRRILDEEESLQVLVSLVSSGTPSSRENAAATLLNLASNDPSVRISIVANDGVQAIMRFLDHADNPSSQEVGLDTICSLVDSESGVRALMEAGFLQQVTGLLGTSPSSLRALAKLASLASSQDKRIISESGCIPHLIRTMAEAKTRDAQVWAMQVLVKLMEFEAARKSVSLDDKAILGMVDMLEEDDDVASSSPQLQPNRYRRKNAGAELAISGLIVLSGSSRNRKQMVACGAIHRLNRLAKLEVSGSRKLLEKLEGGVGGAGGGANKIRNLFKKRDT